MTINTRPLKIFFVTAEVAPYATVGGLSQVMYFLPKALKKLGHDVSIFMPKYGTIDEKKYKITSLYKNLKVPTNQDKGVSELVCNIKVKKGSRREPTVYFLENMEYYEKRANVYGYTDDPTRFALLSRGAIEFLKKTKLKPDIIHANDWHTGYLINYLRNSYKEDSEVNTIASVFTIHNLMHQGIFEFRYSSPLEFDDGKGDLAPFFSERLTKQNSLKRGIIYADIVNTVSERYSREMMTPRYGEGLDQLLKEVRAKVYGVLNGIDYDDFNPATDKLIKQNFSLKNVAVRKVNKADLQKEFNLPVDETIPVISMVGRLSDQKGLELMIEVLPFLLAEHDAQFIIMGEGDRKYIEFFSKLEKDFPKQVGTHLMANWQLPRKIFAGSDIFLLPSRFEPGGIVVVEAMRYGAVPVVRETGGLADIVVDFDFGNNGGTGFIFKKYNEFALFGALSRTLEIYKHKKVWQSLVRRVLQADFSWDAVAKKYQDLYYRAIDYRKGVLSDKPSPAYHVVN